MIKNRNRVTRSKGKAGKVPAQVNRKAVKGKTKKKLIQTKGAYELAMQTINTLMKKGEDNLSAMELKTLRTLAAAAEQYEDVFQPLPVPATLPDMIRMKLFQLRIKQNLAAKLLGISDANFSLIMNDKQKPDIYFIKAVHNKLQIDANQILNAI